MKRILIVVATLALSCTLAAPAYAGNTGWHLRVFAAGFDPNLNATTMNDNGDEIRITAATDLGFGASLEYQFSNRWGVEFGVMSGSPSVDLAIDIEDFGLLSLSDSMSTMVYTLDVDFRLTPNSEVFNLYLGVGIARLTYGDLYYEVPEAGASLGIRVDDDTAFTAKVGLDIALGQSAWSATAALRYTDTGLTGSDSEGESTDTETFDFGLYNFTVGIAFRF